MVQWVIERDEGICHLCNLPGADSADHIVPVSMGGAATAQNLLAAHRGCNSRRSDKPLGVIRISPSRAW